MNESDSKSSCSVVVEASQKKEEAKPEVADKKNGNKDHVDLEEKEDTKSKQSEPTQAKPEMTEDSAAGLLSGSVKDKGGAKPKEPLPQKNASNLSDDSKLEDKQIEEKEDDDDDESKPLLAATKSEQKEEDSKVSINGDKKSNGLASKESISSLEKGKDPPAGSVSRSQPAKDDGTKDSVVKAGDPIKSVSAGGEKLAKNAKMMSEETKTAASPVKVPPPPPLRKKHPPPLPPRRAATLGKHIFRMGMGIFESVVKTQNVLCLRGQHLLCRSRCYFICWKKYENTTEAPPRPLLAIKY